MSHTCNILSLYYIRIRKYVTDTQSIPKNIQAFFYIFLREYLLIVNRKYMNVLYSNNKNDNESEIYFTISIRYEDVDDDDKLMLQDESNLPRPWTHAASNKAKRPIVRYCHMTMSVYPDPSSSLYILPPISPHIPS